MKTIQLTNGGVSVVDGKDFSYLRQFNWHYRNGYAVRNCHYKRIRMHREIAERMGLRIDGRQIDHVNRDKLFNCRSNLRVATPGQNKANQELISSNTSGYKGVSKKGGRYRATIKAKGQQHQLGWFGTAQEAAAAYNAAAIKYFGEYACLNKTHVKYVDPRGTWGSNTSGFRGVSHKKQTGRWVANIQVRSRQIHLGYYSSKVEAARAYNKAAKKHFGKNAYQNQLRGAI